MCSGLEYDVSKEVNPHMTSECWSSVACLGIFFFFFLVQYNHLTNIMYSNAISML